MTFWVKNKGEEVAELLTLALNHYRKEKADLLLKVDDNVPQSKKLLPFPNKGSYVIGSSSLAHSCSYWFNEKTYYSGDKEISNSSALVARRELISTVIDKYIADFTEIHKANLEIIEHNKLVVRKITALMQAVGIPNTYSESYFKSSRSTRKTTDTKKAGYLADIDRNIETSQESIPSKESMMYGVNDKYRVIYDKIRLEETKAERERQAQEELHKVALLRAKCTPDDASSSSWVIREAILSKDKYLHPAYWLERNRGDWGDGYDYAETGLKGFNVEDGNVVDQEIEKCIQECIDSAEDGVDGRIFRDCEYNYGVLYGMVKDPTLLDDLQKVREWMGSKDDE
jgi:hypothetical protein